MRVRELKLFGCSVVLLAVVGQWAQAENGRPSRQTLAAMGLGGMTIMSDDEASSIRGMGFKGGHGGGSSVAVFGNSFATINTPLGSAHSENGYAAEGKKSASGKNYSEAGAQISISNSGGKKSGGNHGSPWGGKSSKGKMGGGMGGHPGGGMGGHGGGGTTTITFKVFAGGFSSAHAH